MVSLCLFVSACGGGGGSSPLPILVNNLSLTTNEDVSVTVDISASNISVGTTSVIVEVNPNLGSVTGVYPELLYTPSLDANGTDSFRIRLANGGRESRAFTINLTINPINDAPQVNTNPPGTIAAFTEYVFDLQTSDADDDPVTYEVENLPAWLQLDTGEGILRGTPNNEQVGLYESIEISVTDGSETAFVPIFDINVAFEPLVAQVFSFESLGIENPNFTGLLVIGDTAVARVRGVDSLNQPTDALCAINLLTMELLWSFVDQVNPSFTGAFVNFAQYSDGFLTIRSGRIKGYDLTGDLQFDQALPTNPNGNLFGGITELTNGDFLISVVDQTTQVAGLIRLNPTTGIVGTLPQSAFYWQLAGSSPNELYGAGRPVETSTVPYVHKFAETSGVIWTAEITGTLTDQVEPITLLADGSIQLSLIGFAAAVDNLRYSSDGVQLFRTFNVGDFSAVATRDDGSIEIIAEESQDPVYSRFAPSGVKTDRFFLDSTKFEAVRQAVTHPLYNVLLATDGVTIRSLSPIGALR